MFTHSVRVFRCVHASLYEALSVRRSVGPSVRGSVRRSGVSQISRKWRLWDNKTSGNNKLKLIQLNSSKFKLIQENSFTLTYIGRIFVRIKLVSYQLWKGLLPSEMASFVGKIDHGHSTKGAKSNFYVDNSSLKSIRSIAPSYWNPLSMEMKLSPSVASFKEKSKRDLLGPYASFSCSVKGCYPCSVSP